VVGHFTTPCLAGMNVGSAPSAPAKQPRKGVTADTEHADRRHRPTSADAASNEAASHDNPPLVVKSWLTTSIDMPATTK
jgi:hypothetical protein